MESAFNSFISRSRPARERAQSWNGSEPRTAQRPRRSLNQAPLPADFLQSLLRGDHDRSSVVSDLPSFHGFKLPECSLHSLKLKTREARAELIDILNDPYLNKEVASERLSDYSDISFGVSRHEARKIFQISNEPFRILDTPGMEDNYYSHLLAWSAANVIAICLAETVYLFNCSTSDFDEMYQAAEGESIASLAFSPQGDHLAIGNTEGVVTVWDLETAQTVHTLRHHLGRVACLDWSDTGLLSGSKDTKVVLSDTRSKRPVARQYSGHSQEIVGLKWNHCGQTFASGGNDNQALVWSIHSSDLRPVMEIKHRAAVRGIGWSHKTPGLLATGGGYSDATIRTFDTKRETLVDERETDGQVCSILFSRVTNDLISSHGLPSNDISVWRTNGLKRVVQLAGHDVRPLHICLSPDATTLVSAAPDETLRFWKLYNLDADPEAPKSHNLPGTVKVTSNRSDKITSAYQEGRAPAEDSRDADDEGFWDPPEEDEDERSDLDFPMSGPDSDCAPDS